MGKVFLQITEADMDTILASVREGDEVVLKQGDEDIATVVPPPVKPKGGRRGTFGIYRDAVWSDDSILDPLPEEELRLWEGGG